MMRHQHTVTFVIGEACRALQALAELLAAGRLAPVLDGSSMLPDVSQVTRDPGVGMGEGRVCVSARSVSVPEPLRASRHEA
jgi:hypothetical protein